MNVDYRLLDIERIELGDDCVDGVLCRYAYMLVADPAAAFAETRRVLRPGGRRRAGGLGRPRPQPVLLRARHDAWSGPATCRRPTRTAPGRSASTTRRSVRRLLEGAGFADVRAEEVAVRCDLPRRRRVRGDQRRHLGTDGARAPGPARTAERAEVTESLGAALAPFRTGAGYEVPGVSVVAVAA